MTDTVEWRWVDVGGDQRVVRFDELAEALHQGALPAFVLVWRTGWVQWLDAASVAELAASLGRTAENTAPVRRQPGIASPPPPPSTPYPGVAGNLRTLYGSGAAQPVSTMPPPPGRDWHAPLRAPVAGIPAPPAFMSGPIPIRDVMPTLAGEELPRSPTLRPAGALPPPPRAMPQQKIPVFEDITEVEIETEDQETVPMPAAAPSRAPALPVPPVMPRAAPAPVVPRVEAPPAAPAEPPRLAPAVAAKRRAAKGGVGGLSRSAVATLTSAGLVLPGSILLAAALMRAPRHPKETDAPSAVPSTPVVASPRGTAKPAPGCRLEKPATRIAETAFAPVPLLLATTAEGSRAMLGLAASKERVLGMSIDPTTLEATSVFDQPSPEAPPLGVVPLVRSGKPSFAVDLPDANLAFARTVDAAQRFTIGVASDGFARRTGALTEIIWPGKSDKPTITTPRIATVPGTGHAVAFRHGGQEGKVLVGWLREDGTKLTELAAVGGGAALVGTPTVAAGEKTALVAFASKTAPEEAWRLELAAVPPGQPPGSSHVFALPPGGPGGEAISPSADGLTDGRFLLQWTEGSAGNRAVRAAVLSPSLEPSGDAITLSSADQNAGQGAVWVHEGHALALYLVKVGSSHELWGASLKCQ